MDRSNNHILWVAALQELGKPYVDLYFDKESHTLLLFVRVSKATESRARYAVIPVSADQVNTYISSHMPISEVFANLPVSFASIDNKQISFEDSYLTGVSADLFQYNEPFDPALCDNKWRLKMVLKKISQNKL